MDQLVWPASFCGPPSPASSFFSGVGNHHQYPALESQSSFDVSEQWLTDGDMVNKHDDDDAAEPGRDAGGASLPPGRKKPGRPRGAQPPISHVEAERQRRDRLNRRFCDLRGVVPTVSRMDRASLLSDAVAYIAELRGRVAQLEEAVAEAPKLAARCPLPSGGGPGGIEVEARMVVGRAEAAVRVITTAAARHAPAWLMAALRALDLPVRHAGVCRVGGVTVQDVVVDVPAAGLREEGRLRAAVLHGLLLQERGPAARSIATGGTEPQTPTSAGGARH